MIKKFILVMMASFCFLSSSAQQLINFSGKITNTNAESVARASVALLNTNFKISTSVQGDFQFSEIPSGEYDVVVSAVGYATYHKRVDLTVGINDFEVRLVAENKQLEEVIVSAQKVEESVQEVPFSVTALSARQIKDYKIWNSKEITGIIPNFYSAGPGDNRNVTSIRGITTTSYDPAVATYIDGVSQFNLDSYIARLLDVDRIEVLRGPQGTLYGRNAMGGVVNVITKQPANHLKGFAGVDFGNYGLQRYSFGIQAPLIANQLFLGVSGLYDYQNGYFTNQFDNSKFDKQNSLMGNYYLKYLPNSTLALTLNVKHNANRNQGTFPLAGSMNDALENPFKLNQNAVGEMVDNLFNSSLAINYTGQAFNFSSQTAYQTNYRFYRNPLDGDFSPIDGVSIVNNYGKDWNKVKTATQEFRFSSPANAGSNLKWVAGTYGFYQDNPVKQGTHFGEDAAYVGADFPNFSTINTNKDHSYGIALFGQATYAITEQLDLAIGARYDYEHKKQSVLGEFQMDGGEAMITRSDTSGSASFKAFSPKANLKYQFTSNSNVYGGYSRGFRAGGITDLASDPSQGYLTVYKPEYSNNFELGSKNTFLDNLMSINVSLFYTRITDAQVPTLVLPDAITVTRNAGELESKGFEFEFASTPLKGLELNYNFGYTDAKYLTLQTPSDGNVVDLKGNRQVFTPNVTSFLALQYGYDLGTAQNARLIIRGDWRYLGNQYFDLANQVEQKAYSLLNARLGFATKKYHVFICSNNIANKKYVDYAYDFGAAHLGNPQTFGISLSTNF
jgi:iron complex outermembrane receptor protein